MKFSFELGDAIGCFFLALDNNDMTAVIFSNYFGAYLELRRTAISNNSD
jgi:hypothetical protein